MAKKSQEDIMKEMETGDLDEDIYTEEGRDLAEEDDEISEVEAGFMEGYKEGEKIAKCSTCKQVLSDDPENIIEEEVDGDTYRFCSEKCAEIFNKKQSKKKH
ncbi:hypothetical protein HY500_00955 [Candidatus Woesearchaeota archaeon]|nr:hypothetical protein [Candidatus Woesearchaeota archaeon]